MSSTEAPTSMDCDQDSINITDLNFRYPCEYVNMPPVLQHVDLNLKPGSRCLLLGSNGAGKTTLLNVAGGKNMHNPDAVQVLGQPAFHNTHPGITLLTGNWSRAVSFAGTNVAYQADVTVRRMLETCGDYASDRLEELLGVLDVNLNWRMHMVSDGQRRRVQILMGLLKPFQVLLLDEVTVDLDVVSRADLLEYLKKETETRGATILYATHIFDGLDNWATHLAHIKAGGIIRKVGTLADFPELTEQFEMHSTSPLMRVVEQWLRAERQDMISTRAKEQVKELVEEGAAAADDKIAKKYCDTKWNTGGGKDQYNYW